MFQALLFVYYYHLLQLSVVGDLCSHVIEVKWLSHLVFELTYTRHRFKLRLPKLTLRVIVAPDSTSPNLKNPVVI